MPYGSIVDGTKKDNDTFDKKTRAFDYAPNIIFSRASNVRQKNARQWHWVILHIRRS